MTAITSDGLFWFLLLAFAILVISFVGRNKTNSVIRGAFLTAFGVLEVLDSALYVVGYVLDVIGVLPLHLSGGWKGWTLRFTPDPYGKVVFPMFLLIGIISIVYGYHLVNQKNPKVSLGL